VSSPTLAGVPAQALKKETAANTINKRIFIHTLHRKSAPRRTEGRSVDRMIN